MENKFKNLSEMFDLFRRELNQKENELKQLKESQNNLLLPDSKQIESLINAINSLHLSTSEGYLLCSSTNNHPLIEQQEQEQEQEQEQHVEVNSTNDQWESNKDLTSNLNSRENDWKEDQDNSLRLPMVKHLFSLPLNAFLASSNEKQSFIDQPKNLSQINSKSFDSFQTKQIQSNQIQDNQPTKPKEIQQTNSILSPDSIYSKANWLKTMKSPTIDVSSSSSSSFQQENQSFNLDQYISTTTDKVRRLHLEYLSAIESIQSGQTDSNDPLTNIKAIYPNIFDRTTSKSTKTEK